MGRLTLNVLLSFAQCEYEVTSERIRDKIAASKRKGLWIGGMVPLGYDTKDRKITINDGRGRMRADDLPQLCQARQSEPAYGGASQARHRHETTNIVIGQDHGWYPVHRGPLAHLLRNRFYIGEITFKGETLPGEQPAIVDRKLFDAIQTKLTEQLNSHNNAQLKSDALLIGKISSFRRTASEVTISISRAGTRWIDPASSNTHRQGPQANPRRCSRKAGGYDGTP